MATANDIITRAYQSAGILGESETPTAAMASDGLVYLNDMIEDWGNQHLTIYQDIEEQVTMDGSTSYTWGSGGAISTTRPLKITNAFFRINGGSIDYPVTVLTKDEYDDISYKTTDSDVVDSVYLYNTYPLAELFVYPVPTSGTLFITTWKPLTSLASLTTSLALPNGYNRALRLNLAVELQSEFAVIDDRLAQRAAKALGNIKRVNSKPESMSISLPINGRRGNSGYGEIKRGW